MLLMKDRGFLRLGQTHWMGRLSATLPDDQGRMHANESTFLRPRLVTQPMAIRLAFPPAAAVLIEVDTSSSSQFRQ